ncbi:hypothetical protein D3C83_48470 [compost metagenome]
MKRFSKMVSVTSAVPRAILFSAMICACMSVGKAGYGAVRTLTAFNAPLAFSAIQSAPVSMLAPASRSLSSTASSMSGRAPVSLTLPPVAAAATRNVPVSMRSGITE